MNIVILPKQDVKVRERLVKHILGLSPTREWEVQVKQHRKLRTNQQNRRYFAIINDIATHIGIEPEDVHEMCKHKFLGYAEFEDPDTGEIIQLLRHSKRLDRRPDDSGEGQMTSFADYMLAVEAWGANMGTMYTWYGD